MANGHGGYRKPTNPAPVSGPGALSKRTDGKQPIMPLSNAAYGEQQTFHDIQQAAPMAQQGPLSVPQQQSLADLTRGVTPLSAPSAQPNTPVTDGASAGPGQGLSALNLPTDPNKADASSLLKYLPVLIKQAEDPATPAGYKAWVRNLIANLK